MNKIREIEAKMASDKPRDRDQAYRDAWSIYPTEISPEDRRILARARILGSGGIRHGRTAHESASVYGRVLELT